MSNVYPTFADPVTWSSSTAYDAFKIVLYDGHAYTSRQAVPAGTALSNTDYWIPTGNIYKLMNNNITALQTQLNNKIVAESKQVSYSLAANERKNLMLDYSKTGHSPIAATITGTGSTDVIVRMVSFGFNVVSVINLSSNTVSGNIDMVVVYRKNN